ATKLGDFFQYAIDKPVSLPRQKSALLPIANKDVEGTRLSIYNERTQAKFPLLGLKLKNTSGLHLMQGPITVFEGSNYAGDARISDIQPGRHRGEGHRPDDRHHEHRRQPDALLRQPDRRQPQAQGGADEGGGDEGGAAEDPARDSGAAAAAERHHAGPGAAAGQPARDA